MRWFKIILLLVWIEPVYAQNVTVSGANSSSNGSYSTLQAAFNAINTFNQGGFTINVTILNNTTETSPATLYQNSGAWSSLTLIPSGNRTVQGNLSNRLIDLDGADNVTINGLNDGTNSLIIDNTNNTAVQGTIRLINDAQNNTIINCMVKGSSTGAGAAIIYFGSADATLQGGNDNNVISNCILRESSSGKPVFGINSSGTSGTPVSRWNSGNIVTGNQFINIVNIAAVATSNSAGIQLTNASNTDWFITNNSFYLSAPVTSTASASNYGVRVTATGTNAFNFVITGNYFGGTAPACSGTPMTWSNTNNGNKYCGIYVNASPNSTASIQGNTVSNILLNTNSNAALTPGVFAGIAVDGGQFNIGDVIGNVIGSNTVNGSITINTASSSTTVFGGGYGIITLGSTVFTISNNQVSGISVTGSTNNNALCFFGIFNNSGSGTLSSNILGSATLNNSIQNSTGLNFTSAAYLAGIYQNTGGSDLNITSNTISNITASTNNGIWQVAGIVTQTATNTISGNNISYLKNSGSNTGAGFSSSVVGINMSNTGGTPQTVTGNSIIDLQNSNTGSGAYAVTGIFLNNSGSGHVVSANQIYNLKNSGTNTSSPLDGIRISQGTIAIYNNMISLGDGLNNNPHINAVNIQGGMPTLQYNSLVVTGAAAGAASTTSCIRMEAGLTGTIFQNNILYNERTSSVAGNNQTIFFTSTTQRDNVTTCNYNDLFLGTSGTVLVSVTGGANSPYGSLALWQANSGKDASSVSVLPAFVNAASDLHLTDDCSLTGKALYLAAITTDYDAQPRSSFPDIGADEYNLVTWIGVASTDWNTASNWSPAIVPTSVSDVIIPAGTPFSCAISSANAVCHTISVLSSASFSMSGNKTLTVYANCTYGGFSNNGTFSAGTGTEEVAFNGLGTVSGTVTFNVVSTNNGLTFSTITTIVNKKFRIDAGGYVVANPPIYTAGSATLQYNTGGIYGRSLEWCSTSGAGYPNNVQISNSTTLNLGNGGTATARQCAGNLTIDLGSLLSMAINPMTAALSVNGNVVINGALTLSTSPGGDISVRGNWTRGSAGVFIHNCRSVSFTGNFGNQTITVTGGGTETFSYVTIDKNGWKLLLGSNTHMKINPTAGCGLGNDYLSINNGDLDLQGRTLYIEGPSGLGIGTLVMNLKVKNGTRSILSSSAGGIVNISSTLNNKTVLVIDGGGAGKILFGNNVEVRVASGEIDFGSGNLGTINYILRINSGGAVTGNAPYYPDNSKLIFSTGTVYDLVSTQQVWETGTLATTPGVPYDVDVNLASTDVRVSDNLDRTVRNDFSILNGTFELGTSGFMTGNLTVGGDWLRNNSGTSFIPNQNKVTFNSTVNTVTQLNTITKSGGGNETFYDLEISNAPGLALSGTTNAHVTNHLYLTQGIVNTGGNEVFVTNNSYAAISGYETDPAGASYSASPHINGNLRRALLAGDDYDYPVGLSSAYQLATIHFNNISSITDAVAFFTSGSSGTFTNCQINGSDVIGMLNGGYWTINPTGFTGGASYDLTLNETSYSNFSGSPTILGLIKRSSSAFSWTGTNYGSDGIHLNATQQVYTGPAAKALRTNIETFSDYAIGYINSVLLPIELTLFDVVPEGNNAHLTWNTSSEINSDFFSVERSIDGNSFVEIAQINAAGNSPFPVDYSYTDVDISQHGVLRIYYRLKLIDVDHSFEYSQMRWVDLNRLVPASADIYPNPFTDKIIYSAEISSDTEGTVFITNQVGKVVYSGSVVCHKGVNHFSIDNLNNLPAGIYYLTFSASNLSILSKAVKL